MIYFSYKLKRLSSISLPCLPDISGYQSGLLAVDHIHVDLYFYLAGKVKFNCWLDVRFNWWGLFEGGMACLWYIDHISQVFFGLPVQISASDALAYLSQLFYHQSAAHLLPDPLVAKPIRRNDLSYIIQII